MNNSLPKLKIAHIFLTLNIGGMEKVGIDLISRLSETAFDNYIICLDELGAFGLELQKKGYKVFALGKGPGYKYKTFFHLVRFLKKEAIQIVHSNNPSPHFWGGLASLFAGIRPRIHTKHGRNFLYMKRRVLLNRISAFLSDKIVCVSENGARLTTQIEKVPSNKVCVIYNGIDSNVFKPIKKDIRLSNELKIKKNDIIIGSISRFNRDKDQETLIRAFKILQQNNPNIRLLLVGDGETLQELIQLSASLGVEDKVIFLGYRIDVKELLSIMNIYVLSSHTEGISISLLEAMAMKIPVVGTNVGGNCEVITHNENGFLVEENSETDLAEKISILFENESLRNRFIEAGRQTVLEKFCVNSMVEKYENLYLNSYRKRHDPEIIAH